MHVTDPRDRGDGAIVNRIRNYIQKDGRNAVSIDTGRVLWDYVDQAKHGDLNLGNAWSTPLASGQGVSAEDRAMMPEQLVKAPYKAKQSPHEFIKLASTEMGPGLSGWLGMDLRCLFSPLVLKPSEVRAILVVRAGSTDSIRVQLAEALHGVAPLPPAALLPRHALHHGIVIVGVPPMGGALSNTRNMALLLAGQVLAQALEASESSCQLFAGTRTGLSCDASCVLEAALGIARVHGAPLESLLAKLAGMAVMKCADAPSRESLRGLF